MNHRHKLIFFYKPSYNSLNRKLAQSKMLATILINQRQVRIKGMDETKRFIYTLHMFGGHKLQP